MQGFDYEALSQNPLTCSPAEPGEGIESIVCATGRLGGAERSRSSGPSDGPLGDKCGPELAAEGVELAAVDLAECPGMRSRNVGMIGLGLMGTAMTERLLDAGYTVLGLESDAGEGGAAAGPRGAVGGQPAGRVRSGDHQPVHDRHRRGSARRNGRRAAARPDPDRHDDRRTGADGSAGGAACRARRAVPRCADLRLERADPARRGDGHRGRAAGGV